MYTDTTGALPVLSLDGHQYYVVAYDYANNFIKAQEVSDLKDETIVETAQMIFDKMEKTGQLAQEMSVRIPTSSKRPKITRKLRNSRIEQRPTRLDIDHLLLRMMRCHIAHVGP